MHGKWLCRRGRPGGQQNGVGDSVEFREVPGDDPDHPEDPRDVAMEDNNQGSLHPVQVPVSPVSST